MEVWKSEPGRPSPIGAFLPASTEQVSHPEKRLGADLDRPVDVVYEDRSVVYQNDLGKAELRIVLEEWSRDPKDRDLADGWAGDQFALYGTPDDWSLRWVILWDDAESRDRFAQGVAGMERLPDGLRFEPGEHDGHPAVSFVVGDPPSSVIRTSLGEGS